MQLRFASRIWCQDLIHDKADDLNQVDTDYINLSSVGRAHSIQLIEDAELMSDFGPWQYDCAIMRRLHGL